MLRVMKLMALMSEWNLNTTDSQCALALGPTLSPGPGPTPDAGKRGLHVGGPKEGAHGCAHVM